MKKKICLIIILFVLVLGVIFFINYKRFIYNRNQRHYAKIKENINPDIASYVRLRMPYCNPDNGENSAVVTYTDETLIYQRGMDKGLLLDVDGKSYCKVRVEVRCVGINEHAWDTYIKCKDYEDINYSNWEERGRNND